MKSFRNTLRRNILDNGLFAKNMINIINNIFGFEKRNPFVDAADTLYRSEFNEESFLITLQKTIPYSITNIQQELICIFYDIINTEPCYYWDKDVLSQTTDNLSDLVKDNSSVIIDDEMLELYIIAYNAYAQITSVINDLSGLNDRAPIKNRQYRLPTYVSIVESCLTNLYRFITLLINQTTAKDYHSNYKLKPLTDILNKFGYDKLTEKVDINIRNAINHGGILFLEDGEKIIFHFNENGRNVSKTKTTYELDQLINDVYDTSSAILLGITIFLNQNWNLLSKSVFNNHYLSFHLLGMKLSIPTIRCRDISEVEHPNQLNAEFSIANTDRTYILRLAVILAILIYSQNGNYAKYYISFSNDRLMTSWIRFTNEQLSDLLSKNRELTEITGEIIGNKEALIFDASTEPIDMQEIKYHRFPNYQCDRYRINNIADASTVDRKRLRCNLFIGDTSDKESILRIITESIEWVKTVKNVDSPTIHHKYGNMEADSIYMNVYRFDTRKDKSISVSNENFVCFVDYNLTGETTLLHGGFFKSTWDQLSHETIGKLQVAWRERKYQTIHKKKIGVNELCPCGSGRKFKKCCRGKGIYD